MLTVCFCTVQEEWQIATAEDFELTSPVTVNWDYMDPKMLSKFWTSNADRAQLRRTVPEEMADRILLFHRGIGSQRMSGLLVNQKLDLLMEYTVFWLFDLIKEKLPKKKGQANKTRIADVPTDITSVGEPSSSGATANSNGSARASALPRLSKQQSTVEISGAQYIASTHKYAKQVERRTLRRLCPNLVTLLKVIFSSLELEEPTFKDLVVVYRWASGNQQHCWLQVGEVLSDAEMVTVCVQNTTHVVCNTYICPHGIDAGSKAHEMV